MKFKLGDGVKLKNYEEFNDYRDHYGQEGIISSNRVEGGLRWSVTWKSGRTSAVETSNLIKVNDKLEKAKKRMLK